MLRVKNFPVGALIVCAFFTAAPSHAQDGPTEEELESARLRLQQALKSGGLPPAAFESDPVPDWAVPNHEPKVLPVPGATAQPETPNQETVDPLLLKKSKPPETAEQPETEKPAAKKPKPKKPAVVRKKDAPDLKTGRAVAGDQKTEKPKAEQPHTPAITLPESLRP